MGHHKRHLRCTGAVLSSILLLLMAAISASAHARLITSAPISGSALLTAPATIALAFSESIKPETLTVTLTLPDGTNHILPVQVSADTTASATVDAALSNARGTWIVRWSVLSATDGHWSDGTIAFSVGTGFAPATIGTDQETRSWEQILLRALWLLLLTAVISTALNGYRNRLILALGAVAIVLIPLATNWGEWGDRSPRLQLLGGLLGALAACVLIMRASRWLPVALIAAALVAIVLSGHASGANHPRAMISLAIVHGLLAIGWLGVVTWIASGKTLEDIRKRIEFSPLVLIGGVILLVGAGITMAILFVPDLASLRATTYGTTLLVKIAIVLLAVGFGLTNWIVVRTWLVGEAVAAGLLRQVRWVLRGEVLVLAAAVCLGATLAETPPPARTALTAVSSPLRMVAQRQSTDGLTIGLVGNLAGTTDDLLTISVTDQSGSPAADVERVIVRTFNGQDEQRFDADPGDSGSWTFSPLRLPYPYMWAIDVTVRRSGVFDTVTSFSLDTRTWVAETPRVSERSWQPVTIPAGAFAFATLAIVVLLGGLMAVRRNSNVQPAIGAVIIIALVAIATGFAIQGVQRTSLRTPDHALALPAEDASIDATVTFQQFCLACHGANAQGIDATNPNHLHGSGTNLVDSGTRRLSDGDLYWLITHGVAGTDMPAYDLALSEAERWELVRHIRLVQKATPLVP